MRGWRHNRQAPSVPANRISPAFSDLSLAARASAVRSGASFSIPGMMIMTAALLFVRWTFHPLVQPAWHLELWLVAMFTIVGFWLSAMIAFTVQRPGDAETVRDWPIYGRIAQNLLNIGIAASPWILLPQADIALQYFTTIMYVWYVAVSIMTGNPSTRLTAWEVLMLTGSVAGYAVYSEVEFGRPLAALLALVGASMLGLRTLVQRTVLAALEAEQMSAASEKATREALAVVASERDAKSRFIASASHDLQQPVYAARLGLEAALTLSDPGRRDKAVRGAVAALGSAQGLLDTMLDYLRLGAGDVVVQVRSLAVAQLFDSVANEYRAAAEAVDMRIRTVGGDSMNVAADPQLLGRALGNLVHNAIRHSGAGRLLLAARRRPHGVEIWVIDDGCGLGADAHQWLFEDFAKGNVSMQRGLGLGLASVRRQLALMRGSVSVSPRWKRGAAFVVCLPEAQGA